MTTSSSDTSSRKKTLLIALGVILALVLILGAVLVTRPELLAGNNGSLTGAAVGPRGFMNAALRPKYIGDSGDLSLAEVPWTISGGGHYVVLWQWDTEAEYAREWHLLKEANDVWGTIYVEERTCNRNQYGVDICEDQRRYLAVKDGGKNIGDDVITFLTPTGDNRFWQFIHAKTDPATGVEYYLIRNMNSRLCLTVRDAATTNGGALVQGACNEDDDTYLWRLFWHW